MLCINIFLPKYETFFSNMTSNYVQISNNFCSEWHTFQLLPNRQHNYETLPSKSSTVFWKATIQIVNSTSSISSTCWRNGASISSTYYGGNRQHILLFLLTISIKICWRFGWWAVDDLDVDVLICWRFRIPNLRVNITSLHVYTLDSLPPPLKWLRITPYRTHS